MSDAQPPDPESANRRRRVLFVTFNFAPKLGGLEQVVEEVWRELGLRTEVVTLAQHAPGYPRREGEVVRAGRGGLLGYILFLFTTGLGIARRGDFDLVVAGSALVALPVYLFAKVARARAAVIVYGLDCIHPSRLYQGMYRFAVPRLDRVIAISHATRDEAVARGVREDRIEIVYPGCHGRRFSAPRDTSELRRRWQLDGTRVILSAGRLVKRKGIDRFVRECLPRIVERVPEAKLLLVGANPEEALAHGEDMAGLVREAAKEVGMSSHVIFTGRVGQEELERAFQLADVFVLPVIPSDGDMEGFGIVLLEAAAAGTPSVATRIGGVSDAVVDGETGVLVPPLDYLAMANAIVGFLTDEEKLLRMGGRGRDRVMRELLWEQVAPRYADALLRT